MIDQRQYANQMATLHTRTPSEQMDWHVQNVLVAMRFVYNSINMVEDLWNNNGFQAAIDADVLDPSDEARLVTLKAILSTFKAWDTTPIDDADLQAWLAANLGADNPDVSAIVAALPTDTATPHGIISRHDWSTITLA